MLTLGGVSFWWYQRTSFEPLTHADFAGGTISSIGEYPEPPGNWSDEEISGMGRHLERLMEAVAFDYRTDGDVDAAVSAAVRTLPKAVRSEPEEHWSASFAPVDWRLVLTTVFAPGTNLVGEPQVLHRSWSVEETPPQDGYAAHVSLGLTQVTGYQISEPEPSYLMIRREIRLYANHSSPPSRFYPAFSVAGGLSFGQGQLRTCDFLLDAVIEPVPLSGDRDEFIEDYQHQLSQEHIDFSDDDGADAIAQAEECLADREKPSAAGS